MMKVIELFAGIGAQREALKEVNIEHEVVAICEIDSYAFKAYEILHGKTLNLGDIQKVKQLPPADLWTCSFPCTDISLAGKMKGFQKDTNTQSSLLWEVKRLLEEAKSRNHLPRFLLLENVKNLISKKFFADFQEWSLYLESFGYKNFYKVLNAKNYNVPQNRERVFMLSVLNSNRDYIFPLSQNPTLKLKDLLDLHVDEKYFLSDKVIANFTDMTNRNGFIRGLRFKPQYPDSPYAFTISTRAGFRSTDNFIICPAALRGRINELGSYEQILEMRKDDLINTLTTVTKDNLLVILPENTKKGFAFAEVGDGIYTNRTYAKRGVVLKNEIPTLKTSVHDIGVVVNLDDRISIRKITPKESLRMMGWKEGIKHARYKIWN